VNLAVYGQYVCKIELASNKEATALEGRQVDWVGETSKDKEVASDSWNNLGNLDWANNAHGFSQWGNQGGNQGNQGGNHGNQGGGWGNQGNQGGNGWGNQGGNQGGNNDGWGGQNVSY
jgi:hypothetical protein